jgi:hypothetical protein
MAVPGFTADASLYDGRARYRTPALTRHTATGVGLAADLSAARQSDFWGPWDPGGGWRCWYVWGCYVCCSQYFCWYVCRGAVVG